MNKIFTKSISVLAFILGFGLSANAQVNLNNGLIAYYSFDGDAKDRSGQGHDFTVTGATLVADKDSRPNAAYSFDGVSNFMKTASNGPDFGSSNSMTCSVWYKTSTTGLHYFLYQGQFGLWTDSQSAGVAVNGTSGTNSASGTVAQNAWVHLLGTYDGSNITTYINGVQVGKTAWTGGSFGNPSVVIGDFSGNFWAGQIDELYFYNRVLSADEIAELFKHNTLITVTGTNDEVLGNSIQKELDSIYNIQGQKVSKAYSGLVIYKYTDGTTEKVIQE